MKQKKADIKNIYIALANKQVLQSSIVFNFGHKLLKEQVIATLTVYYNNESYYFSNTFRIPDSILDVEEKAMVRMFSKFLTSLYAVEVGLPNDGNLLKHNTPVTETLKQYGYLAKTSYGGIAVNTRNVHTLEEFSKVANIFGYAIIPQIDINKSCHDYEEAFERLVYRYGVNLPSHELGFTIQRIC